MAKFDRRALIIIVPFGVAFLLAFVFICKHKIYLWSLKKDDSGSDTGAKVVADNNPKNIVSSGGAAGPYAARRADLESGGTRGAESESDSVLIAQSGNGDNRNSFFS